MIIVYNIAAELEDLNRLDTWTKHINKGKYGDIQPIYETMYALADQEHEYLPQ